MPENRPHIPNDIQRAVFTEAGHRCAVCGTPFPLERAHIVPWSKAREHCAENLICLCSNCHERADRDWDQETLRQYKQNPWVARQYERSEIAKEQITVEITIRNLKLKDFDETNRRWLQYGLASFLGVSPHEVQIEDAHEGSLVVRVRVPKIYEHRLNNPPSVDMEELRGALAPFDVVHSECILYHSSKTRGTNDRPPAVEVRELPSAFAMQAHCGFVGLLFGVIWAAWMSYSVVNIFATSGTTLVASFVAIGAAFLVAAWTATFGSNLPRDILHKREPLVRGMHRVSSVLVLFAYCGLIWLTGGVYSPFVPFYVMTFALTLSQTSTKRNMWPTFVRFAAPVLLAFFLYRHFGSAIPATSMSLISNSTQHYYASIVGIVLSFFVQLLSSYLIVIRTEPRNRHNESN